MALSPGSEETSHPPLSLSSCKVSTLHSNPMKYLSGPLLGYVGQGEGTPPYAVSPFSQGFRTRRTEETHTI